MIPHIISCHRGHNMVWYKSCDLDYATVRISTYSFSIAEVRVAFQQETYSVREGDGSVAVCVEISGVDLDIELTFNLSATIDGSATFSGMHDSVCYTGSWHCPLSSQHWLASDFPALRGNLHDERVGHFCHTTQLQERTRQPMP